MVGWLLALYADYFISIKFNIHFSYPAAWQAHSLERCLFCYHGGDWSYFSAYISSLRLWDFWPSQWFLLDPGKDYTGADLGYSWLLPKPFWVMLSVISSYNFAVSLKPRRCKSEQNLCQLLLNILIFKTYMALWEYALFLWSSLTIFLWNHSFKTITVHFFSSVRKIFKTFWDKCWRHVTKECYDDEACLETLIKDDMPCSANADCKAAYISNWGTMLHVECTCQNSPPAEQSLCKLFHHMLHSTSCFSQLRE